MTNHSSNHDTDEVQTMTHHATDPRKELKTLEDLKDLLRDAIYSWMREGANEQEQKLAENSIRYLLPLIQSHGQYFLNLRKQPKED